MEAFASLFNERRVMRSSSVEEVGGHGPGDPWEVFTALAILVVEGRTAGGERGYHAGPHCPLPHQLQHKHSCDLNDRLCMQADALVRQLRVMWGVGVGVSLEVLVAPECQHGAALAATLDTTTAPSQNLRLIEQWNFTIYDRRLTEATATGWSLMAAVRSFLHFSQLSAWLSVSRGRRPPNVLYRLTVTSPVFCSKFTEEAEEHVFPLAYMGQNTSIKVAVRSLPRSEKVPVVVCHENHEEEDQTDALSMEGCVSNCSQNSKAENGKCEEDLRRSIMKARLAENTRVRSESPDTQLGESLLDPPNSLTRFPRRYQSPSRSGSPSLETPEHLICRQRSPTTLNTRPPDPAISVAPNLPSHPFSWTQARYPMTPMGIHHPHLDVCSANPEAMHLQQPQQHQQQHMQQNPYGMDYAGPYQQYRRPQLLYNRPHMCWSQVQLMQQQQKPHLHPNPQPSQPLSHNPSYVQQQKPSSRVSPRGGKYQHYPEYQMQDFSEYHRVSEEERELPSAYQDQKMHGEYPESDAYSGIRMRGEYPEVPSKPSAYNCSDHISRRGEDYRQAWECQKDQHGCKKVSDPVSSSRSSTRVKQSHLMLDEQMKGIDSLSKVIDDQLRPCCSHTGKHLCTSLEDLADACSKEELKRQQMHSKDLKQDLKSRRDVSPSHLLQGKFNFELTPKETMEILSVLRQPTPVPPLRMDRHHNPSETEFSRSSSETKSLKSFPSERKSESQIWGEKSMPGIFSNDGEKRTRYYKEGRCDASPWHDRDEVIEYKLERGSTDEGSLKLCREGPKTLSSFDHSGHNIERCHKENWARGDMQKLASSPENRFLEAIARSGEKHCDIPSCKNLVDSCEPYWTRVINDKSKDICDKRGENNDNESVTQLTGIVKENEWKNTSQSPSMCIEAKKVTQKTNFFTVNSEPTKAINCQPQRQTSQTLVRSPFSAILSSIQKEYNQVHEEEQVPNKDAGRPTSDFEVKEKAKRALDFEDLKTEDPVPVTKADKILKRNSLPFPQEAKDQAPSQENGNMVERVRETREGFTKSRSLLKHLMTQGRQHPQDKSQDIKQPNEEEQRESLQDKEAKDEAENGETPETNGQVNGYHSQDEDEEVKKLCSGKGVPIPSASEKAQFRRSLDSATNMVFHCKTGLPLTSSPAPLRKGKRFDYDSSLTSVAAIKRSTSFHCSALYTCDSEEEEGYSLDTLASDKLGNAANKPVQLSTSAPATVTCSNLLGSFEECVLNGRLEPVSTVQGFTAEIAASGAFCPKRTTKPVTVFFYTLCDNDQISSPYMGHINLGKKGYHVPNKGTVQVTLFNPHGTVVKMFVVMYDLSDMPPNSRTFVRQRTLNMPVGATDSDPNAHQWLRYLIHLRFVSSKSGKIYLHTDIRMLIFRKSDADAATLHKTSVPYELRSFTHGPTNPKFSPRK